MKKNYFYLNRIHRPEDIKNLDSKETAALAAEIRDFLVEKVGLCGGHLASNLGVVELSIALHKVFDTPRDRIIWDVGHQAYVHKILTGRKDAFDTLRTPGGLSGFTKRFESEYDPYGAGHSSTSISAALGFAQADALLGRDNYTVAVLGDGAFTGGLVHEALNNIRKNLHLIIVLNENEMSISKNIGVFSRHIAKIRATRGYLKTKTFTRTAITRIPLVGKPLFRAVRKTKKSIKNALYGSNYFEDLGLYYLGPADGNNAEVVETLLREAAASKQSVLIHLKTTKGKGYRPAEENPNLYHAVPPRGEAESSPNFSQALGKELIRLAEKDRRIVAITAAMADGCGLTPFAKRFPSRFFDVGIAEEHALIFAAGLAAGGMKPVVPIYSSFLQRGYDSILHDIALQNLPVVVPIDRAALAWRDGATHHGIFDVSFLSGIPGVTLYAPATFASLKTFLNDGLKGGAPTFIRYPNSGELLKSSDFPIRQRFALSTFSPNSEGLALDGIVMTYGGILREAMIARAYLAQKGFACGIIVLEKLLPLEIDAILSLLPDAPVPIVFLEEGIRSGGVGVNFYDAARNREKMKNRPYRVLAINALTDGRKGETLTETCGIAASDVVNAFLNNALLN